MGLLLRAPWGALSWENRHLSPGLAHCSLGPGAGSSPCSRGLSAQIQPKPIPLRNDTQTLQKSTKEGFGWPEEEEDICMEGPFLWALRAIRGGCSGRVSAELWGVCTTAWTPLLLLALFIHCSGQDAPQHPDSPAH